MMMENRRVFGAGGAEISEQPACGRGCGMREGFAAAAATCGICLTLYDFYRMM